MTEVFWSVANNVNSSQHWGHAVNSFGVKFDFTVWDDGDVEFDFDDEDHRFFVDVAFFKAVAEHFDSWMNARNS